MTIEGIPVAGIELLEHICWYCGQEVPRDDDSELIELAIALSPQPYWEIGESCDVGIVYVHRCELQVSQTAMNKAFSELIQKGATR